MDEDEDDLDFEHGQEKDAEFIFDNDVETFVSEKDRGMARNCKKDREDVAEEFYEEVWYQDQQML